MLSSPPHASAHTPGEDGQRKEGEGEGRIKTKQNVALGRAFWAKIRKP